MGGAALGWITRAARTQRDGVAAIKAVGGCVGYDWEDRKGFNLWRDWAPNSAIDWVGPDYFTSVKFVYVPPGQGSDAELVHIGRMSRLRVLYFFSRRATNAGLAQLRDLRHLEQLELDTAHVTDGGLSYLRTLSNLESLSLTNAQITDSGLASLERLTKLRHLALINTRVSEHGLDRLQKSLPDVHINYLAWTRGQTLFDLLD
jgi:hypothetical protein